MNITIQNDRILDQTESFFVSLERTLNLDSKITLDPTDGEIEINGTYMYMQIVCSYVHRTDLDFTSITIISI